MVRDPKSDPKSMLGASKFEIEVHVTTVEIKVMSKRDGSGDYPLLSQLQLAWKCRWVGGEEG